MRTAVVSMDRMTSDEELLQAVKRVCYAVSKIELKEV